ncbi:hypothetical protein [Sphingosinicella sp. CPCC 101087]|uniref:hypothetical protein n=1 Tax=Sphingosinicella sp. CPCC 101087 TaxID=2497754 RepID=UPI00101C30D0|nr:hypothetical protein [Sphingosinicella sp. CPCC 101087]
MSRGGSGNRLERALRAVFASHDVELVCESRTSRPWTSITFAGERHALALTVTGAEAGTAADAFLAGLGDIDMKLPGHLLVDISAVSDERDADGSRVRLGLEALTVETG